MEKKYWKGLLILGIMMHFLAAALMPLGLDAYVHASYVADGMDDGDAHLEWGELRSENGSTPTEVAGDDKWFAWHLIIEMWFTAFSPTATTLHVLGLVGGLGCLAAIFLATRDLFGNDNALKLTALASIYPPLIRATGRVYQEGVILLIVTIATYSIIKAMKNENKINSWWLSPILCAIVILSFKGMPLWYVIPAILVVLVACRLQMNQIQVALFALLVQCVILFRNEVELSNPDIIPALLSAFIGYFLFVKCGMLILVNQDSESTDESILINRASMMITSCLVGWVAALWVTEAVSLDSSFFDIVYSFRNNPRYLSLLLVPLWFGRMLQGNFDDIFSTPNKNRISVSLVVLLLIINAAVLSSTGQRGTDAIGEHLESELSDNQDILFISDEPLSMHRLYSIKFSSDPYSELDNDGIWRTSNSDWKGELDRCELHDVNFIIFYVDVDSSSPENWVEVEFEGADGVSENYRLYTWGGENERCS